MGQGIEAARTVDPAVAAAMENMRDQLLLVLLRRLGGEVSIPVSEIDDTGGLVMMLRLDGDVFHFELRKTQ